MKIQKGQFCGQPRQTSQPSMKRTFTCRSHYPVVLCTPKSKYCGDIHTRYIESAMWNIKQHIF